MLGNKNLWGVVAVAVLVVMVASLISCGPTPAPTTAPPQEETEEAAPAEETSVTIVIPEDPPGFNGVVVATGYEQLVMELTMLGMTDIDPEGNIFKEIAAEIPTVDNGGVALNDDGTMDVTWKMREDVYWADGEKLTADDMVFTWNALADPETGIWIEGLDYTDSIEKIDDFTFVMHYNSIYPDYRIQLGAEGFVIWPEHYCQKEGQGFTTWDCNRDPLSSGPYVLEEWVESDHLTFKRNPKYYEADKGKPYIDTVIVKIVPEQPVRKTMILEGDADVNFWLSETVIEDLKDAPNVKISFSPSDRWVMRLHMNEAAKGEIDAVEHPHPILNDVLVRRAIRMAIDVDTITEEIFHGYPNHVWTEFFRPPYNVCNIPEPKYDPEGAKALLEEAGWKDEDGDGIRECHGCKNAEEGYVMKMEFLIYAEYGEELELAQQLIAEQLKAIGIDLELGMVEGNILWAGYGDGGSEQHGNFDIDMWDDGYFGLNPSDFLWLYYHSAAMEPDAGWNAVRWSNEEFDALLDETYTLDEEVRKEKFCEMAKILDDELPQILMWSAVDASAYSSRVEGVQSSIQDVITWNVADWKIVE